MLSFVARRLVYMVVVLALISLVSFYIINLPPGSWIETYAYQLESSGSPASAAQLDYIRQRYGLDQPLFAQYLRWIVPIVTSLDFGFSFEWQQPVGVLIGDRLLYSATHQYSLSDYVVSFLGVIGLATPSFLLALVLLVFSARVFGVTPTGLLSPEYMTAPWTAAKWLDLLVHLPVPVIVVGLAGTAATIRILRSQLLDEFHKQYVTTARAKGLTERKLLLKYPFRMALNPIVSTMGTLLPSIVSGSTIVAIVLGLPTIGPLLLRAIVAQDTYVAASCLMMLGAMTVIGVFLSDILLMLLDPRVRMERSAA